MDDAKLLLILQDANRTANALEKIAGALSNPKSTSEFRVAALQRQSHAIQFLDRRISELQGGTLTSTYTQSHGIIDLEQIRKILLKN